MLPLLEALQDGKEHTLRQLIASLADHYKLSDAEREEQLSSGNRVFSNRVSWAKLALKNAGLIDNPKRGVNIITEAGQKVLGEKRDSINCNYLRRFPPYLDSIGKTIGGGNDGVKLPSDIVDTQTPEEALEAAYLTLRNKLAGEVLECVKKSTASFFEQLVVELLVAMGYGGSLIDAGKAIGRPGDGGIDGVIKEDELGLDVICLQAKCWEKTVGSPEVHQFAGSMEGYKARKGVLITTSSFSKDAKEFVKNIDRKIVLIDGIRLAQLMIDHGIGVAPTRSYVLKKLDPGYFDEDEG